MKYRDQVALYQAGKDAYGQTVESERHVVPAIVEQTAGLTRGGSYDALTGDARAYLPGSDAWLCKLNYQLEGYYLKVARNGVAEVYRVVSVSIGRASATTGKVQHIEVELQKVDKNA